MSRSLSLLLALFVTGCATVPSLPDVSASPPPPPAGLESLLNQPPEAAFALLGKPRLDKKEGSSRQLQFAGNCVLDLWYYPQNAQSGSQILLATHADARQLSGQDMAPGACRQILANELEATRKAQAQAALKSSAKPSKAGSQKAQPRVKK